MSMVEERHVRSAWRKYLYDKYLYKRLKLKGEVSNAVISNSVCNWDTKYLNMISELFMLFLFVILKR